MISTSNLDELLQQYDQKANKIRLNLDSYSFPHRTRIKNSAGSKLADKTKIFVTQPQKQIQNVNNTTTSTSKDRVSYKVNNYDRTNNGNDQIKKNYRNSANTSDNLYDDSNINTNEEKSENIRIVPAINPNDKERKSDLVEENENDKTMKIESLPIIPKKVQPVNRTLVFGGQNYHNKHFLRNLNKETVPEIGPDDSNIIQIKENPNEKVIDLVTISKINRLKRSQSNSIQKVSSTEQSPKEVINELAASIMDNLGLTPEQTSKKKEENNNVCTALDDLEKKLQISFPVKNNNNNINNGNENNAINCDKNPTANKLNSLVNRANNFSLESDKKNNQEDSIVELPKRTIIQPPSLVNPLRNSNLQNLIAGEVREKHNVEKKTLEERLNYINSKIGLPTIAIKKDYSNDIENVKNIETSDNFVKPEDDAYTLFDNQKKSVDAAINQLNKNREIVFEKYDKIKEEEEIEKKKKEEEQKIARSKSNFKNLSFPDTYYKYLSLAEQKTGKTWNNDNNSNINEQSIIQDKSELVTNMNMSNQQFYRIVNNNFTGENQVRQESSYLVSDPNSDPRQNSGITSILNENKTLMDNYNRMNDEILNTGKEIIYGYPKMENVEKKNIINPVMINQINTNIDSSSQNQNKLPKLPKSDIKDGGIKNVKITKIPIENVSDENLDSSSAYVDNKNVTGRTDINNNNKLSEKTLHQSNIPLQMDKKKDNDVENNVNGNNDRKISAEKVKGLCKKAYIEGYEQGKKYIIDLVSNNEKEEFLKLFTPDDFNKLQNIVNNNDYEQKSMSIFHKRKKVHRPSSTTNKSQVAKSNENINSSKGDNSINNNTNFSPIQMKPLNQKFRNPYFE